MHTRIHSGRVEMIRLMRAKFGTVLKIMSAASLSRLLWKNTAECEKNCIFHTAYAHSIQLTASWRLLAQYCTSGPC